MGPPSVKEMLNDLSVIMKKGGRYAEMFTSRELEFIKDVISKSPCLLSTAQVLWIDNLWNRIPA